MITTKKTKISIGAKYHKSYTVSTKGKRIKADHVALAEINRSLREAAMVQKQIAAESKRLAAELYAGG